VIRLKTITLRHFHAGERASSTTPKAAMCGAANSYRYSTTSSAVASGVG
jgi:hypothetical protein